MTKALPSAVWPGGFHGFDLMAPHAALSQDARAARFQWLRRLLATWPRPGRTGGMKDLTVRLDALAPQAGAALRLTAEGTPGDPGPRVVHADEAGGLMVLARTVGPQTPEVPDVAAVAAAAPAAPWVLATLDAVAAAPSLRAAATALRVHHSTLQERVVHAERLLGWPLGDPQGRFRLHLALALRRLHRAASLDRR